MMFATPADMLTRGVLRDGRMKQIATWLSSHFWLFEVITVAAVAYFLANAAGQLLVDRLVSHFPMPQQDTLHRLHRRTPDRPRRKAAPITGEPILQRNIFDSKVGPIDRHGTDEKEPEPEPPKETTLAPCLQMGLRLLATVVSEEREDWSFATIAEGNKKSWHRVGDTIGEREIAWISWRYLLLEGPRDYCYIDIFGDENFIQKKPRGRRARARWLADLKKQVQVLGANERVAGRHAVNQILANPVKLVKRLGARPRKIGGRVVGFQLRRMPPRSPMTLLGLQRQDILRQINGIAITSQTDIQKAFQKVRSARELRFSITRKGRPVDLSVRIQ